MALLKKILILRFNIFIIRLLNDDWMEKSEDPVIIGFIVTVGIIGLIVGITLFVFLCIRWRDYKRHQLVDPALRQTRRRKSIRVHWIDNDHANNSNSDQFTAELPPPYSEQDTDNPPPYQANLDRIHQNSDHASRRHTTGSLRIAPPARSSRRSLVARNSMCSLHIDTDSSNTSSMTPAETTPPPRSSRRNSVVRNSLFSVHINTGSTNTPPMTQAARMVLNAQRLSISAQGRVTNENLRGNVTDG